MSRVLLFECAPRQPADGSTATARLSYKHVAAANSLGVQWEPVVESPPTFESAIGFDGRNFGALPVPQVGGLGYVVTDRTRFTAGLIWKEAAVTLRMARWPAAGGNPADGDFATIWTGRADAMNVSAGRATVTLLDAGQVLRVPAITAKFGTSGDALLDSADAVKDRTAGAVVPMAWGKVLGIPGSLVDRANLIWLFAGRAATSLQGVYDGGAAITLGVARASLAALIANVPAAGTVDYCLNAGGKLLMRPWTTPVYPFTADATFGVVKAADIASAIVTGRTALTFKAGAIAALNAAQAADHGLYLDDETTIAGALDRLLAGSGIFWRLTAAGTIDMRQIGFAAPIMTVAAHLRGAPERKSIVVPTGRRSIGYARNNKVHTEGDIAAIILAGDLAYADGTPVEALKPAAAGADVTAAQPIVRNLSPTTGKALSGFTSNDGTPFNRTVAKGEARNGDVITFSTTLPSVPLIVFSYGGAGPTAGQSIYLQADSLSVTGFTAILKTSVVTAGATYNSTTTSTGSGSDPARMIDRSNAASPYNGSYIFTYAVTAGSFGVGEPGNVTVTFYVRKGGSWVEVGSATHNANGTYTKSITPGAVDFGAGAEFGMTKTASEGSGAALTSFSEVSSSSGTVTDTSLTPPLASPIAWEARL